MAKYHVNAKGEAGSCRAKAGNCPFGGEQEHYASAAEAREAFEQSQASFAPAVQVRPLELSPGFPLPKLSSRPGRVTLLQTVHGSHLYGLAHAASDLDTYRVVTDEVAEFKATARRGQSKVKTKQTLDGNDDVLETSLTSFLVKCDEGVPQALEAMFSPYASGPMDSFRNSYFLNTPTFAQTYRRTIGNFARLGLESEEARAVLLPAQTAEPLHAREVESLRAKKPRRVERNGMLKYRRHALRLMLNLETGLAHGRFNPSMTEAEKTYVKSKAELEDHKYAQLVFDRLFTSD